MISSAMIDLVIAAALLLCAALGWNRGLIRTLAELAAVFLALIFASQIARAAAPVVVDKVLRPATHAAIEQRVEELARESAPESSPYEELERVVASIPNGYIREQAQAMLAGLGGAAAQALAPTRESLARVGKEIADEVLDGVVLELVRSVLCAVCFVILAALLRLAARVLRLAEKLPGIRQLNKLGGGLAGLGKGLVLTCLALWVLRQTGVIGPDLIEGSVLAGLLFGRTGLFG